MTNLFMKSYADISDCGKHRYTLTREWGQGPHCIFIMLNPSTADAVNDDPTIRRCIGFAKREGKTGLTVINLYSLRTPHPEVLWNTNRPERFGPRQDAYWQKVLTNSQSLVIAAWGAEAVTHDRELVDRVGYYLGHRLMCFGKTKSGQPRHPLYLRADAALIQYMAILV